MLKGTIQITFKADSIADLKLQIQEYSLTHLGLNFKALAESAMPKNASGKPGHSEQRIKPDGSIRLHNPNYPSAMQNADVMVIKKPRGRPVGWRKHMESKEGASVDADDLVTDGGNVAETKPEPLVPTNPKDLAKFMIHEVNNHKGYEAAVKCLDKFGVTHLSAIPEEKYDELIEHCKRVIAGDSEPA